jgi:hypothetical protein
MSQSDAIVVEASGSEVWVEANSPGPIYGFAGTGCLPG